jgi:hypothetical protein
MGFHAADQSADNRRFKAAHAPRRGAINHCQWPPVKRVNGNLTHRYIAQNQRKHEDKVIMLCRISLLAISHTQVCPGFDSKDRDVRTYRSTQYWQRELLNE